MNVRVRFFAQFGEVFGPEILQKPQPGTTFTSLIKEIAAKNSEGYDAIFDEHGAFHEFVILMKNGKRVDIADAAKTGIDDGDEIAVFPPVAGG
jgi:molybdopterin synthase sulfur carrier subunit